MIGLKESRNLGERDPKLLYIGIDIIEEIEMKQKKKEKQSNSHYD